MTSSRVAGVLFALAAVSLLALVVGHLALTDIHHGESDAIAEWRALQVCFGVLAAAQAALLVLGVFLRRTGKRSPARS